MRLTPKEHFLLHTASLKMKKTEYVGCLCKDVLILTGFIY